MSEHVAEPYEDPRWSAYDRAQAREAVRLFRRYEREIVEALCFCPWAARARTAERVLLDVAPDEARIIEAADAIADDTRVEVGFVIMPRARLGRADLMALVQSTRAARQARGELPMAMEGFHPDAAFEASTPARLVPFVRRTPDPTIQLTRMSVIERVKRSRQTGTAFFDPSTHSLEALLAEPAPIPLAEEVARANAATIARLGSARVCAMLDDIRRDRDETYARLARES